MLIANKKTLLALAMLSVLIAVGLPLAQILRYENVMRNGTSYKVKCTAYDPYDPFMGRYVRLNLRETVSEEEVGFLKDLEEKHSFYHRGFIEISADENGFVRYEKLIKDDEPKLRNKNYLNCTASMDHRSRKNDGNTPRQIRITVRDINRYYMNEKLAKPAEDAIREVLRRIASNNSDSEKSVYLELKVLNTRVVPAQLYIDNVKIEDYIKREQ